MVRLLAGGVAEQIAERVVTGPEIDRLLADRFQKRTVTARLRTLSSVIADEGIQTVDLLKVNVEKSELDVLRGLTEADWKKVRQLVIEVDTFPSCYSLNAARFP